MRHLLRHAYTLFDKDLNPIATHVEDAVEAFTNNDPEDWYDGKYTFIGPHDLSVETKTFLSQKAYAVYAGKLIVTPYPDDPSRVRFRVLSSYTAGKLTEEQKDTVIRRAKHNLADRYLVGMDFEPIEDTLPIPGGTA